MTIIFPTPETPFLVQEHWKSGKSFNELRQSAIPFRKEDRLRAKYLVYLTEALEITPVGFNSWTPDPNTFYSYNAIVVVDRTDQQRGEAWIKSSTVEIDAFLQSAAPGDVIAAQHDGIVLKIWINRLLHLCINTGQLTGVNSYIEDKPHEAKYIGPDQTFFIEFGFKTGHHIIAEYNERGRWEEILKLVDENVKSSTVKNP